MATDFTSKSILNTQSAKYVLTGFEVIDMGNSKRLPLGELYDLRILILTLRSSVSIDLSYDDAFSLGVDLMKLGAANKSAHDLMGAFSEISERMDE